MNRYFGTDGIRGVFGIEITPRLCYFAGRALCLRKTSPTVLLARDTRRSGEVLARAFLLGVRAGGGTCHDLGILPTPGLSFCMSQSTADFGVVVSASHNPEQYNGLKFFSADGTKFSAEEEKEIEKLLSAFLRGAKKETEKLLSGFSTEEERETEKILSAFLREKSSERVVLQAGPTEGASFRGAAEKSFPVPPSGKKCLQEQLSEVARPEVKTFKNDLSETSRLREAYFSMLCSVPLAAGFGGCDFSGMKIALDLAGGSTGGFAERVFLSCGARVAVTGGVPGMKINDGCGATHPERISAFTCLAGADLGFAFDGDGDRVLCCGGDGKIYDGDDLLVFLSRALSAKKAVGTVLTNGGVARALRECGTEFFRSAVGDRCVADLMKQTGATVGAETAGHILLFPQMITGDGILAALRITALYRKRGKSFFSCPGYQKYPAVSVSLRKTREVSDEKLREISAKIADREADDACRVVLRNSGTEPVVRLYAESADVAALDEIIVRIIEKLRVSGIVK